MDDWEKELVVVAENEVIRCPGCKRDVAYSEKEGWIDVFGFKQCKPATSLHSSHIDMLLIRETKQ